MVTQLPPVNKTEIFYPSEDGEPLAETSIHVDAIINAVVALRHYLTGQAALVLANQFLYYAQGYPKLRVAPDVMVIFDVEPGPRDNYKIWEEGQVPVVIFEFTSEGTKDRDQEFKKTLYEQLEVQEYWLFDPKGEWIPEQLRGYRLQHEAYQPITDQRCAPLELRLAVEGALLGFYREDTGEKLLVPDELVQALQQEMQRRSQAEQRVEQAEQLAEQAEQRAEQAEQARRDAIPRLLQMGLTPEQVAEALGLAIADIPGIND
jgi:Uma2 family endonuclease